MSLLDMALHGGRAGRLHRELVLEKQVAVEADGRKFVYRARVQRDAVIRRETKSFLSRVFDGAAAPAIVHFLDNAKLSPEEIQKLRERLDREAKS